MGSGQFWPGADGLYALVNPCRGFYVKSSVHISRITGQRSHPEVFSWPALLQRDLHTDQENKRGIVKTQPASSFFSTYHPKSSLIFDYFYVFQEPKGWSKKSPLRTYNDQVEAEGVVHISKFFCAIPAACLAITSVCLQRQQRHVFASLSSATTISLGIFLTGA